MITMPAQMTFATPPPDVQTLLKHAMIVMPARITRAIRQQEDASIKIILIPAQMTGMIAPLIIVFQDIAILLNLTLTPAMTSALLVAFANRGFVYTALQPTAMMTMPVRWMAATL